MAVEAQSIVPNAFAFGDGKGGFADVVGVPTEHGAVVCSRERIYEVSDSGCTAWKLENRVEVTAWVEPTCSREGDTLTINSGTESLGTQLELKMKHKASDKSEAHAHELQKRGDFFVPDGTFTYEIRPADSFEDAKSKARDMLAQQKSD